jgi:hypothetical protein
MGVFAHYHRAVNSFACSSYCLGEIMGWAGGCDIAAEVWYLVRKYVPESERREIARKIYDMFCDKDADAWEPDDKLCIDAGISTPGGEWI